MEAQKERRKTYQPNLIKNPSVEMNKSYAYLQLSSLENQKAKDSNETVAANEQKKNLLGTVNGVFVPCLLNIIGIILFLRLGWAIGQAGVLGLLLIFAVAETQALLTVLSASALVSNGKMSGGGSYYLISRSLGPEFGGSIGIQFYLLYAIAVSFYLVGLAEEVQLTFFKDTSIGKKLSVILISSLMLFMVTAISIIGIKAFAKINQYLFILQFSSIFIGTFSMLCQQPHSLIGSGEYTGIRWNTFVNNFYSQFSDELDMCGVGTECSLSHVYAIVFPLATGFMEGLNLSGDLRNAGRSIPVGTLYAIASACAIYFVLIIVFASSFTGYTLRNNLTFFQEASASKYIVIIGIVISCFSSGLGALFGASRILQAIARDKLFKFLTPFKQGSIHGDEPQYAVMLTWSIAQVCIFIGDLDSIAPICTSFFCLTYFAVNFACFILQVTGVPNYRPTFKYSSRYTSFIGAVLNLGIMFYLNAVYASFSLLTLSLLFLYLYILKPQTTWGDVSQALIYHQVRKYLLQLDTRKSHNRFWRPSILLMTDDLDKNEVYLCDKLKKGGLYVLGGVVVGDYGPQEMKQCLSKRNNWLASIQSTEIKAIPQVIIAKSVKTGYEMMIQCSGLGGMQINTIALPWFQVNRTSLNKGDLSTPENYISLVLNAHLVRKNIILLRNCQLLDPILIHGDSTSSEALTEKTVPASHRKKYVDVWINCDEVTESLDNNMMFALQLAYCLHCNSQWKKTTSIRIIQVCQSTDQYDLINERNKMMRIIENLRIPIDTECVVVVSAPSFSSESVTSLLQVENLLKMNSIVQRNSKSTCLLFMMLPNPFNTLEPFDYLNRIDSLTGNLPPTLIIWGSDEENIITTTI